MIPVRLARDAARYLREEAEWLRLRNPAAARNFSASMKAATRMLREFPEAGNQMHGLQIAGSLTLVVGNYLLDYIYDGARIDIISIRHGRMLAPTPDIALDNDLEDEIDSVPNRSEPSR
ncbi:MAG TPA: type II toxin-antitoxin system RelE/ParE family toxin [Rhizobium sp.]|nr:type II toxin-antitoxin system RelE/ParE family toxin [Rhizobium sp.]